jgi:hypothetical protein
MAASRAAIFTSSRHIWAIGIALCVITLLGCGIAILGLRRQVIEQQRVAVTNLSVVLAEQTARYVQVVNLVLEEVQSRVASFDLTTPDELAMFIGTETTRGFLRDRLKNLPQANAFSLIKGDGKLFLTTRMQEPADLDVTDRDYYRPRLGGRRDRSAVSCRLLQGDPVAAG